MREKIKVGFAASINGVFASVILTLGLLVFLLVLDTSKPLQSPTLAISLALLPAVMTTLFITVTFTLEFRLSFIEAFVEVRRAMLEEGGPTHKLYLFYLAFVGVPLLLCFTAGAMVNITAQTGDVLSGLLGLIFSGFLGLIAGRFLGPDKIKRVNRQIRRSVTNRSRSGGRPHRA